MPHIRLVSSAFFLFVIDQAVEKIDVCTSTLTPAELKQLQFKMREAQMCNILCRVTLDAKTAKAFKEKIDDEYRVNM